MPLSNRQKLEIIARAKKNGYKGDYLELFRMAEQRMRQDKPEVEFRGGGFANDINKPGKSTYVDARSGYGFPTTYRNGGPDADIPPYESLTDFQKQNIGSSVYNTFVDDLERDNREIVPGPGGTLDSLAMNTLYETTKRKMQPDPRVYIRSEYMKNKEDLTQQLKELQEKYPESKFEIQRDPFGSDEYYVAEKQRRGKDFYVRGKNESEMQKELNLLKQGHQGIMPHMNNIELEKLYEYKKTIENSPEDFADDPELLENINANIASREGKGPEYILGESLDNIFSKTNYEADVAANAVNIAGDDPLYSHGVGIPTYEKPVGRSIPLPTRPEIKMMPTIPAGPISNNLGEPEMQKIPMPTFPDRGPSKSDLFFEGLENAQGYYNRPDEFTRGRRQGDPTVSTQYIFSDDNPYTPKKGQYFMSEPNTRGKRKYDGDLNAARKWEREQGLGTQADLKGYNVGNNFSHGGFAAFFASDYDKYVQKKENGGEKGKPNTEISERDRYRNFLKREEAGTEYMKSIDSAIKKPDGTYYKAFEDGLYYPYIIKGENEATIGYGRKRANVLKDYAGGITEEQALQFMDEDIDNSLRLAQIYVEENKNSPMYGDVGAFGRLDSATQYMLADYPYNVGKLSKFPNFAKAVLTNDPVGAEKEYKRVKDKSTNEPLKRNIGFYKEYVQPFILGVDKTMTSYPNNISNQMQPSIKIKPQDM